MVQYCLEFPQGSVRHFPDGTYNAQVDNFWGQIELSLMSKAHSVWYTFKHLKMTQWGEYERKLVKSMMPVKAKIKPTRRLDALIRRLWPMSYWAGRVQRSLINERH